MTTLKVNEKAPAFKEKDEKNNFRTLNEFKGKKLVLYFYPKDDTPGCTAEACNLRDNYEQLIASGYCVLGVSPDSVERHKKFIEKHKLPFSLLADTEHKVALAYGVWVEKNMYGRKYMGIARTTFIIDVKGKIEEIITKVDTKNHSTQIL